VQKAHEGYSTVDFLLTKHRDIAAAKRFFKKAIASLDMPEKVTLDGYEAAHSAVQELRQSQALPIIVSVSSFFIVFDDGLPVIDTLEEIKTQVAQVLADFKTEVQTG
jgi:transposase-like protein